MQTIKTILSDKRTSIAIVALAIIARIIQLIFFYNIRVDGMYQVMAMQNFVEGHGISTAKVLPGALSTIIYEPLINWPPGYSIILAPFYILFGHNYMLAGMAVDILGAILLIFTCRKILRLLDTPVYLVNVFTLLTGFFIYYFYFINSSDAIAISFFMLGIYYTIKLLKKGSFSLSLSLLIVACLFLSGLIKYLFIPVVYIVPLFILLKGWANKNKGIERSGLISFLLLVVSLGAILIWQKINTGSSTYISESGRGFFPGNLANAHPAIPSSFINPDTPQLLFGESSTASMIIFRVLQGIHIILFLAALVYMLRKLIKKGFKDLLPADSFFYLAFFLSAGITIVLVILSLTVTKEENIPGHLWTYVEEPRYYGMINVLVHLGIFVLYQYYRLNKTKKLRYLIIVLFLLLLPETFRGILFTANRVIKVKTEKYSWQQEWEIQDYADLMIKKYKQPGEMVAVTGSSYYINYRIGIYNHIPVLLDFSSTGEPMKLKAKKPTLLLIVIQQDPTKEEVPIESRLGYAGSWEGFDFYIIHAKPD